MGPGGGEGDAWEGRLSCLRERNGEGGGDGGSADMEAWAACAVCLLLVTGPVSAGAAGSAAAIMVLQLLACDAVGRADLRLPALVGVDAAGAMRALEDVADMGADMGVGTYPYTL